MESSGERACNFGPAQRVLRRTGNQPPHPKSLLGDSWVVISRVIRFPLRVPFKGSIGLLRVVSRVRSPLIWGITVTLLITPLITTHDPPSRAHGRTDFAVESYTDAA